MASKKYCEYFDVNESYFPCIDESAINAGAPWETTYPHETFIDLLNSAEKMLGGTTNRSIWIHGAYGTGKSQCAYALKKILEVPNDELRAYWDRYEPLKKNKALLEKLIGHKEQGVLTAYRYASGSITSPQLLFLAVQESIRAALDAVPGSYKGENTLKESVIAWLTDSSHNAFVNSLLQKPEWVSEFSQSSADEIINSLRKRSDVSSLMESIFKMAEKEGITALSLTADSLCAWIKDIVAQNHTKVVLIWDEFSGFFRQNRNSLDEFQKIVALCQETHFYFVIVTHPITSIAGASISKDDPMSVVQQRYKQIEITLPPNIAFELIGHAFSVIPAAKDQWEVMTGDLNSKISASKIAVMKAAVVKSDSVMQHMLPIHPMAALVLKNIASAFQSNQRSMFDFIKTPKDLDVHAFQWFIQNTRPDSDRSLLTVDMLWDFFYEKGKDYLTSDIKLILDTYPQQTNLTEKEKVVLKTILIMQAVDQRLGGTIPVLKATDQNLSYAFEGDWDVYENECKSIAKALVKKGVLIQTPIADGKQVYSAAVLAGDGAKIDRLKDEVRKNGTITKLVEEGTQLASALSLTPPLRLRYAVNTDTGALPVVTVTNFVKMMDQLKVKDTSWHFFAVLALARTDEEAQTFRNMIKKTIGNAEYKTILVIDALSSPLGLELFEEYVSYSAMSMYYNGNNNQQSKDNARKAREVLDRTWRDRIHDGSFIVWSYANQDGEKATGANAVHTIMQTVVLNRYNHVPDFTKGLTESQLKNTQTKQVAKYGFGLSDVKGLIAGCEKTVLGKVWNRDTYWSDQELEKEPISIIKRSVDKLIHEAFRENGRISIDEICELLETAYGFAPCNLTAFVLGFLLKEYKGDPFRSQDSEGLRESMTPDKLSEMIGNYYSKKAKTTYIVSLTPEEKSFYELTEKAWRITPNTCTSPTQASSLIQAKMRDFVYPVWTLEEVDNTGVYDIVKKYIALIQSDGKAAHTIAIEIGKIGMQRSSCGDHLQALLTADNCLNGMSLFIQHFEGGKLSTLAKEIGASDHVLSDIKKLFSVKHAAQWIASTGEDEIRKLTVEYSFVKVTNALLNVSKDSKEGAFKSWREFLKFLGLSCESIQAKYPALNNLFTLLLKIVNYEDILPDNMKMLRDELTIHNTEMHDLLSSPLNSFIDLYAPYLTGFSHEECEIIKNSITEDMFVLSATKGNAVVKKAADDYRKGQVKDQLFRLWSERTGGTKSPKHWSEHYKTPILCCIDPEIYGEAKKAFAVLNSSQHSESEIKMALEFCEGADFFDVIADSDYRNKCFMEQIVGCYSKLLPDITAIRSALEDTDIAPYDWADDPRIKAKIKNMASVEYNAGGSDAAINTIESMPIDQLKTWLKQLAVSDMELGVKIISNGGKNA
ncbi:MAG: hypothetical protein ACLVKM_03665 [Oscillospiraceae bacterium]|jgi:hypothetical protein